MTDCSADVFTDTAQQVNSTATTRSSANVDLHHLRASDYLSVCDSVIWGSLCLQHTLKKTYQRDDGARDAERTRECKEAIRDVKEPDWLPEGG